MDEPSREEHREVLDMATNAPEADQLVPWRLSGIGLLRILFGIVFAIDAWFKWQPDFVNNFKDYLTSAQQSQPWPVHHWIGFWVNTVGVDPTVFAYAVAATETAIAIALVLGVFMNLTSLVGVLLTVVIWSTAEGFGGPYKAGSTDIGAAIIYALVFAGLFLSSAGLYYGFDRVLTPKLGKLGVLASGWFQSSGSGQTAQSTRLPSPS
jgi:uncharacterized membrane protein YphA (DoxX/SURF4 family)